MANPDSHWNKDLTTSKETLNFRMLETQVVLYFMNTDAGSRLASTGCIAKGVFLCSVLSWLFGGGFWGFVPVWRTKGRPLPWWCQQGVGTALTGSQGRGLRRAQQFLWVKDHKVWVFLFLFFLCGQGSRTVRFEKCGNNQSFRERYSRLLRSHVT